MPPIGPSGNYPTPPEGVCPAWFADSFDVMGVTFRSKVPVNTNGGVYLGYRYNFDATPKSRAPYCGWHGDGTRLMCEQWPACQDPHGADFYMWLSGKFAGDRCDLASADVGGDGYWCHHKPRADETGPTTVCALPFGSRAPRTPEEAVTLSGKCTTVDVRP